MFKKKSKSFLGVDLGAGGIKVIEIEKLKERSHLLTYGYTERPPEDASKSILDDKKTGELLSKICKKSQVKSNKAIAGLPISAVFSSIISVSPVSEKELKSAVEVQAQKLLPYPLEEAVLDWKVLKEEKKDNESDPEKKSLLQRVLLTAAPKDLINKYVAIFKTAKLELLYLETEAFALVRSLVGKDKSTIAIVDIGATKTNILIVDNGTPMVTRSINMGGAMITKVLSEKMKINLAEAEEMKKDMKQAVASGTTEDKAKIPKPVELLLTPVINEINYSFNLYLKENSEENSGKKIEKIILTGGTALFPNLAKYFSEMLKIKVFVGNPWARMLYPDELRSDLDELGSRFSVAIGLAMRDIE
ncbi:MAG: type IV pilus assembly protein PilM [Parcubacteria group bacterium]|nr:type IV pilus assembly protein PilM [Parcubacteria group bacterium]